MKHHLLPVLLLSLCSCSQPPKTTNGNAQVQGHYDPKTGRLVSITYDSNKNGKIDTWSYMDGARVLRIEIDKDEDGRLDRWEYYTPDQKLEKVGWSRANDGQPDAWGYPGPDGKIAKIELAASTQHPAPSTAPSTEHPAPSTEHPAPSTAPSTQHPAPSTAPSTQHPAQGTQHPAQGTQHPAPSTAPSTQHPALSTRDIVRTEYYANGALVRAEEDTNADGRIDKWETWRDGAIASLAFDSTGRGTPDRRLVYGAAGKVTVEVDPTGTGSFKPASKSK